jgi:hypothetical protein
MNKIAAVIVSTQTTLRTSLSCLQPGVTGGLPKNDWKAIKILLCYDYFSTWIAPAGIL